MRPCRRAHNGVCGCLSLLCVVCRVSCVVCMQHGMALQCSCRRQAPEFAPTKRTHTHRPGQATQGVCSAMLRIVMWLHGAYVCVRNQQFVASASFSSTSLRLSVSVYCVFVCCAEMLLPSAPPDGNHVEFYGFYLHFNVGIKFPWNWLSAERRARVCVYGFAICVHVAVGKQAKNPDETHPPTHTHCKPKRTRKLFSKATSFHAKCHLLLLSLGGRYIWEIRLLSKHIICT